MYPELAGLRLRRQPVPRSQIEQDVSGLPDHELSIFEERRREGRRSLARFHHSHHRGHAVATARDIGVAGARLFQREADIFAAALNGWPVIELVTHRWHLRCRVDRYNKSSRGSFVTPNAASARPSRHERGAHISARVESVRMPAGVVGCLLFEASIFLNDRRMRMADNKKKRGGA